MRKIRKVSVNADDRIKVGKRTNRTVIIELHTFSLIAEINVHNMEFVYCCIIVVIFLITVCCNAIIVLCYLCLVPTVAFTSKNNNFLT